MKMKMMMVLLVRSVGRSVAVIPPGPDVDLLYGGMILRELEVDLLTGTDFGMKAISWAFG